MKPKTKSELMAEWASQPGQLKKEREVKAIRKAMDDARAVMQDGLTRYVKKKTKARSMAKAEADPFAELEGWESMEQIQDAYGYGEITADKRDKLTDLWEAREAAQNSRKGDGKYHDLVTEMLETAIRRVGSEYADMLFEYDRQRREAEKAVRAAGNGRDDEKNESCSLEHPARMVQLHHSRAKRPLKFAGLVRSWKRRLRRTFTAQRPRNNLSPFSKTAKKRWTAKFIMESLYS